MYGMIFYCMVRHSRDFCAAACNFVDINILYVCMAFSINIKNLGRLTDADIRIGNFTVFAGPNNTGKSFVSKALYSIFGALNANHVEAVFDGELMSLEKRLQFFAPMEEGHKESAAYHAYFKPTLEAIAELRTAIKDIKVTERTDEFASVKSVLPIVRQSLEKIDALFSKLTQKIRANVADAVHDNSMQIYNMVQDVVNENMQNAARHITELNKWKDASVEKVILSGISHGIRRNLIENFQARQMLDFYRNRDIDNTILVEMESIGSITCTDKTIVCEIEGYGLHIMQQYSRVLYMESPIFLRLAHVWHAIGGASQPGRSAGQKLLTGAPKYVYDMMAMIREVRSGDTIAPEVVERLTSDMVLGGKVNVNDIGEFSFQDANGEYALNMSAVGIANLGVLAMLIERNVLDTDTFLFIDEPEAHLHTKWQVEIAEALFALSKKGVKVVIATHSAEIMKWLEVRVKEHPEDADGHIALNHFSVDGTVTSNGERFEERIHAIQNELAHPFATLYYRG